MDLSFINVNKTIAKISCDEKKEEQNSHLRLYVFPVLHASLGKTQVEWVFDHSPTEEHVLPYFPRRLSSYSDCGENSQGRLAFWRTKKKKKVEEIQWPDTPAAHTENKMHPFSFASHTLTIVSHRRMHLPMCSLMINEL